MGISKIKSKLTSIGKASVQNAEEMRADIQKQRAAFEAHLGNALELTSDILDRQSRENLKIALHAAHTAAKSLGQYAYDLFPKRRLRQFADRIDGLKHQEVQEIGRLIHEFLVVQKQITQANLLAHEIRKHAQTLRSIDTRLAELLSTKAGQVWSTINNNAVYAATSVLHALIQPVGWSAEQIARPLKNAKHWYTGGKAARFAGYVIDGFLSRESLAKTGLETSWGVRFIVPGTAGFIGNAGPWVMLYTGRLRDYQTMTVPFRVNPGATIATDVATFTMNRPGFGAGSATPFASGYVDAARSKLLVGRDGILYVRIGEWEGRGSYFTVSAFIPLLPWMHITWNFSIFSPGWAPLVVWSRPAVHWVRAQADWLWKTVTQPAQWLKGKRA